MTLEHNTYLESDMKMELVFGLCCCQIPDNTLPPGLREAYFFILSHMTGASQPPVSLCIEGERLTVSSQNMV